MLNRKERSRAYCAGDGGGLATSMSADLVGSVASAKFDYRSDNAQKLNQFENTTGAISEKS